MKTKFARSLQVFLATALAGILMVSAHAQEVAAATPDLGFTHDIKHYPTGSKTVLVFDSATMIIGKARFGVSEENVDANIELLSKFLKWTEIAQQRGDTLNKEIGMVKGFDLGLLDFWNKYEFQTSQSAGGLHYVLCVQPGNKLFGMFNPKSVDNDARAGGPVDFKMYFGQDQVKQIIQRMQDFKDGKLKSNAETATEYN
jgi:hypothetical protein